MNEIIYSPRVRQFIGSYEEVEAKRMELLPDTKNYLRVWPLDRDGNWVLEVWRANAAKYTRAG
jgi:hypothetical protein